MVKKLPATCPDFMMWSWGDIEPHFQRLEQQVLTKQNIHQWMLRWTRLSDLVTERYARLNMALTANTADFEAEGRYNEFLDSIYPAALAAENRLKRKLLESGLEPRNFQVPIKKMRVEASIFRTENLPLLTEERKLASAYNKVIGAQTLVWNDKESTIQQMRSVLQNASRNERQKAWELISQRQLADRQEINNLWQKLFTLRSRIADNAGMTDYRSYRWNQMQRLDYAPDDCLRFQVAIEDVAVPAATQIYERYRQREKLDVIRPWDLDQDLYPIHQPPLPPYGTCTDLQDKTREIFTQINAEFGNQFSQLQKEELLDLENRKGKAPGAYCTGLPVTKLPYIFMNAIGLASDIKTLIHESGHAFHNFERLRLPYAQQRIPGLEFAEVASMAMELLALPYLSGNRASFYDGISAAQFMKEHLEHILIFWPYMAVVDAFQHWAYTHGNLAANPGECDRVWLELWRRFIPGVDWFGLEAEAETGWQRKQHIFRYPYYYVEYGMAQLGAVQIWRNSLSDRSSAVIQYRQTLRLGGTATLPELYRSAGARFAFDAETLKPAVDFIQDNLLQLEKSFHQLDIGGYRQLTD